MTDGEGEDEVTEGAAEPVLARRRGEVLYLTLNRPPLNILDVESLTLLGDLLEEGFTEDAPDGLPGILVLQSEAGRAFSAGADVADHRPDDAPLMLRMVHRAARGLWSAPCVTVAAVSGLALGAGMELAVCCDLVVADESAEFGQPEVRVGSYPPVAAAILPERIGAAPAADLILTGRRVGAREALSLGLVSRCAPAGRLGEEVERLLSELARSSPAVRRCAVKALRLGRTGDWSRRLEWAESVYLRELLPLDDAREGVEAFLEKRVPRWTSR